MGMACGCAQGSAAVHAKKRARVWTERRQRADRPATPEGGEAPRASLPVSICVPTALLAPVPRKAAWLLIAASALVHGVYNLLLIASYRYGEFNQVYPVARGTSPPAVRPLLAPASGPAPAVDQHDHARRSSLEYCQSALSSVRRLTPARRESSRQTPRYSSQKLTG